MAGQALRRGVLGGGGCLVFGGFHSKVVVTEDFGPTRVLQGVGFWSLCAR